MPFKRALYIFFTARFFFKFTASDSRPITMELNVLSNNVSYLSVHKLIWYVLYTIFFILLSYYTIFFTVGLRESSDNIKCNSTIFFLVLLVWQTLVPIV